MAPNVILLHSMGASRRMWRAQLEAFAGRYEVIAPDLPGHGHAPGPFTMAEAVAKVGAAVDDLTGPVYLVGTSLGGAVALQVALARSERITGLLLSGAPVHMPRHLVNVQRFVTALLPIATTASTSTRIVAPANSADADALLDDIVRAGKSTQAEALRELAKIDVEPRLPEIDVPTLVCCGGRDRANMQSARILADRMPNATLRVIPDAGHLWNLQRPDLCTEIITELVDGPR